MGSRAVTPERLSELDDSGKFVSWWNKWQFVERFIALPAGDALAIVRKLADYHDWRCGTEINEDEHPPGFLLLERPEFEYSDSFTHVIACVSYPNPDLVYLSGGENPGDGLRGLCDLLKQLCVGK